MKIGISVQIGVSSGGRRLRRDLVRLDHDQAGARDQLTTREDPEFLRLRRELFDFIKASEA